jgi:hypothetical protein
VTDCLFDIDGDTVVPTEFTLGPWGADLMHGGAIAALMVTVLEGAGDPAYRSARLSLELLRPQRVRPLEAVTRIIRTGRRLQLLEAELCAGDDVTAKATLLRLRPDAVPIPESARAVEAPAPDRPSGLVAGQGFLTGSHSFWAAHDVRARDATVMGLGSAWFRLNADVLPGRPPSPMARVSSTADFGNGISSLVAFGERTVSFVNADLTVSSRRDLDGEWVRLESASDWREDGTGLTQSRLWDERGEVAIAVQTLVLTAA